MRSPQHLLTYVLVLAVLAAGASALTVTQPTNTTYDGLVPVQISADANETALAYEISTNQSVVANNSCSNCSQLNSTENLTDGNYSLLATATGVNVSTNQTVLFTVQTPAENTTDNQTPLNLSIHNPQNKSYQGIVPFNFSTNTPASISYALNDDNQSLACENCTSHTDEFNLTAGNYSLVVWAQAGNQSVNDSVAFSVRTTEDNQTDDNQTALSLRINEPTNKSYQGLVPLNFSTNLLANISFALNDDNQSLACGNCTSFTDEFNLSSGSYTLTAFATTSNQSVNETVAFSVRAAEDNQTDDNQTDDNRTDAPRFTTGFNKLPQAVENGEISDAQLAEILRNNQLNPGVINRLVKTGQLGNQSIDAIIDHQWTPPGIFRKVAGFFGLHIPTPKERLAEQYNLTAQQQSNLLSQEDVSEQGAQEIRKQLEQRGNSANAPGQANRGQDQARGNSAPAFNAGGQDRTPPGQQRQAERGQADSPGNSANAPGQANRGQDQARGNSANTGRGNAQSADEQDRRGPPANAGRGNGQSGSPGNSANAPGRNR